MKRENYQKRLSLIASLQREILRLRSENVRELSKLRAEVNRLTKERDAAREAVQTICGSCPDIVCGFAYEY
jgi:hypothetical protein